MRSCKIVNLHLRNIELINIIIIIKILCIKWNLKKMKVFCFLSQYLLVTKIHNTFPFPHGFFPSIHLHGRESAESNWPLLSSYHLKRCVCDIYRVIYLCCALLIVSYRRYVMLFICFYMRDQVM